MAGRGPQSFKKRQKEQQRKEKVSLEAVQETRHAPAAGRVAGREGQRPDRDIRVSALSVRMSVMAIVLADPPAVAEPDTEIADQEAKDIADPPGPGDLLVTSVMAEKAHLREHDREEHRHR